MKRRSVPKLKRECWKLFSRYVRLRDCLLTTESLEYGECISCGATVRLSEAHAGHYIHNKLSTYFDEQNVNLQCAACNTFRHGNLIEYRHGLIEKYGEGVPEEIEARSRIEKRRFTIQELEDLKESLKKRIGELER